ncbi:COMM domain containing 3 [Nesidiocoris tenuis]|uniref:COMM domain-containing protein 3 n=1 Tax=Nesidiocoris tenuis TaxID=355587 RepID=A0ABN7AND6_9HEMI|nr:COMM domain containing 3 [Nesidiocoris tenuis]
MKLSTEISTGLKKFTNALNDEQFELLLKNLSLSFENPSASLDLPPNVAGADVLKKAYAALFTLIVEGVRWKEDGSIIRNILKDCKLSESRATDILNLLDKQRIPLQISLKQTNFNFPHVLDVTWKMNYIVKSSYSDIDGKALYFIDFIVAKQNWTDEGCKFVTETVNIVCTVNHLQSLVAALRAASRKLIAIGDAAK